MEINTCARYLLSDPGMLYHTELSQHKLSILHLGYSNPEKEKKKNSLFNPPGSGVANFNLQLRNFLLRRATRTYFSNFLSSP